MCWGTARWQEEMEWASSLLQDISGEELGRNLGGSLQGRVFFLFFFFPDGRKLNVSKSPLKK